MADLIQIRRDTASNWTSANTVLAQGELGAETDTSKIKIGDGSTAWNSLGYLIDAGGYITATSTNTLSNKTLAATTLSGQLTGADQTVSAINLKDYGEITNALGNTTGAKTIDLTLGNSVTATTTGATTWTFSNPSFFFKQKTAYEIST